MLHAFVNLNLVATASRRSCTVPCSFISKTFRLMSSGLSEDEKHNRFFQMEHENWEEGFEGDKALLIV